MKYQNLEIGKNSGNMQIEKARDMRTGLLILYATTDLKVAVSMSSKFGFQVIPKTDFHHE